AEVVGAQHVAGVIARRVGKRPARPEPAEPMMRADPVDEPDDLALDAVQPGVLRVRGARLPREHGAAADHGTASEQRCTHSETSDGSPLLAPSVVPPQAPEPEYAPMCAISRGAAH